MKGDKEIVKPDWFDLHKYNQFKNISSEQWAHQLTNRRNLVFSVFSRRFEGDVISRHLFNEIKNDPLLPSTNQEFGGVGWKEQDSDNKTSRMFKMALQPLTFRDLNNLLYSLPDSFKDENIYSDNFESEHAGLPVDNVRNIPNFIARVVPRDIDILDRNIFHICMDFDATDKQLIKDFEAYLKAARAAYGFVEGQKIKSPKTIIKQLLNANVMPYLDLTIWAELEDVIIHQHTIGDWLFPDDMGGVAEKIRKTTRPLSNRAISTGFISTLSSLSE